jgi:outer membrane receptor protein involved in Fe transport
MRDGFADTESLSAYYPVNLGIEYRLKLEGPRAVTFRLDVTNLFDQSYELNDGTGIGEGAPKFGARRGIYGGITCDF